MATITLPVAATQNVVATTSDYSAKKNLGTHTTGSYLREATILVYDEILRFQRGQIKRGVEMTHGLTPAMIDAFDYNNFEANVLWFMDELVGLESDWLNNTSPSDSTAYGYVQFTEASVKTAVTRYRYHIRQFNARRPMGRRDWVAPGFKNGTGIFDGDSMEYPGWLTKLEQLIETVTGGVIQSLVKPMYKHEKHLGAMEYDEVLALAFVHLHSKESWDYNFVQLALGGEAAVTAAKEIYKNNHHMVSDGGGRKNILETLTPKQKTSVYGTIKKICQPIYGVSTSQYYDETYFNLLKGYIGSYFYKKYDWFNTNDTLNIFEFAALNLGNIAYQIGDMVVEGETLRDAYTDYAEQAMGVFKAWQDSHGENAFIVRDELKGKIVELQLHNETLHEDGSSIQLVNGPIVFVGFDKTGEIVVWEQEDGNITKIIDTATQDRIDQFFKLH